jgi:hypothetical protein
MKFIKQIPHQSARSPRITDDYFDEEALRIKEIGKLYGIDLYYPIVDYIRNNSRVLYCNVHHTRRDDYVKLSNHLNAIGHKALIDRIVWEGAGWFDTLVVDLNIKK